MENCDVMGSDYEREISFKTPEIVASDDDGVIAVARICKVCGTSKTPLWRSGPAGPKSLCNACGIKSRKKELADLGLNRNSIEQKPVAKKRGGGKKTAVKSSGGKAVMKFRKKLGEVEIAALQLMSLSRGSF